MMKIFKNNKELEFAINLVAECSKITHNVQQQHITKQDKADRSPVTIADYAVQAYVFQALKANFPEDNMVGEEASNLLREEQSLLAAVTKQVQYLLPETTSEEICEWIDFGQGQPKGRYWVLDPVDGTKGFLRRMQYATALALLEDGEVILGVVGCPDLEFEGQTGVIAYAFKGQRAWWIPYDLKSEPKPLRVSNIDSLEQLRLLRSFEDSHTDSSRIQDFVTKGGIKADPVRMDSQAKYVLLAAGQAELMMRLVSPEKAGYHEYIWDQAPGYRVLLEAGGKITDSDGKSLDFSTGRRLTKNRGIFVSNGKIHDEALKILHQT
jgi:3'(2'), 5'-bisphosphate nucleotidase